MRLNDALKGRPPKGSASAAAALSRRHLELAGDGVAHLRAQVVEQLGADTLVHGHFGTDRTDLTVRLRGTVNLKPDQALPLRVAPEHLHLFDPGSGARLGQA